jgi:hypothetical protein
MNSDPKGVNMHNEHTSYISFILRLWPTVSNQTCIWRATLEHPDTGKRVGFASLDELCIFLQQQTRHKKKGENWNYEHTQP